MSTLSLLYESTMEFSTNKYIFGTDSDTSKDIEIGLGTYILKGVSKDYPISFDLTDNGNIELIGLYQYTTDNAPSGSISISLINQPYTYVSSSKDTNNFYYGNVALKVTGDFGTIPNYYFVNNNLEVNTVSRNIKFNKGNKNGSKVDLALESYEIQKNRLPYFFEHNGNRDNGTLIECRDKDYGINTNYYSYVKAYYDLNKSNCLYVGSNSLPNYHSYHIEELIYNTINKDLTEKTNLWNLNAFLGSDVYNYGINRQSFGYINNKGQIVGKPFKIPIYTNTTDEKEIPPDLFDKDNYPRKKEAFWYTNNTNWKEIMVNRRHNNINLGNNTPNSLTPIGPIGVAVNGVPFYNHYEMTDTITETDIDLPIKQRNINLDNVSNKRTNKVIERNYDTTGGTIDKNFNYHYNKYPVGLDAMIKYGNLKSGTELYNETYGGGGNISEFSSSNSIHYFNVVEVGLKGYIFSFFSSGVGGSHLDDPGVTILNNNLYNVGTPGIGLSPYIYIKGEVFKTAGIIKDSPKTVKLQGKKGTTIITKTITLKIEDSNIPPYYFLKKNNSDIEIKQMEFKHPFIPYTGTLIHIDNANPSINAITFINKIIGLGGGIKKVKLHPGSNPIFQGESNFSIAQNGNQGKNAKFDYRFTGTEKKLVIDINAGGTEYEVGDILLIDNTDTRITVKTVDGGAITEIENITENDENGYNNSNITIGIPTTSRSFTAVTAKYTPVGNGLLIDYTVDNSNKIDSVTIVDKGKDYLIGQKFTIPGTDTKIEITSLDSSEGHSALLGFAFDGFPIYGQVGYRSDTNNELKLLRSSYNDNGKYIQDSGDLDICNGIFRATPEFPEGIYHYVCTLKTTFDNSLNRLTVDISNGENIERTIYQYPYIMGAYRGIPELDNFTLPSLSSTISTSLNGKDSNPSSSNKVGQSSQLIVDNNTYYEINMRTIKSKKDTFNYQLCNSIDIKQDNNHINIRQGIKPLIRNFSGDYKKEDDYFGKNTNNFGGTLAKLANTSTSNSVYLKCYGNISKFNYSGTVYLGRCVKFTTNFKVSNWNESVPILGVVIKKDTTNTFCYVCTKGICEVSDISGTLVVNDLLSSDTDGSIKKYDVTDLGETNVNYILGTYIGKNGSGNYLINIKTQTVLG